MFATLSRSWSLIKASAAVLRSDSELLVFPLISSVAALLVAASFLLPLGLIGGPEALQRQWGEEGGSVAVALWTFAFYLTQYFVIFFFNSALVGAAMIRLKGGDPTVADGFRIAFSRIGAIFGYALIAATVGLLLRALQQRAGWLGRWVAGLLGVAWTVATFLAVPVLVAQNVGPIEALKQSASMLKRTWGENLVGNAGIGAVGGLLLFAVILLGGGLAILAGVQQMPAVAVGIGVLTVIIALLLGLVQAALSGIYSAALYRYASEGEAPQGFDSSQLGAAFRQKG
ncbi:DUF6159 family protein [Pseudomarimonas salicorniae]|uniref:DUF6159 family protein n=1 Tax=Pseudomarimonas salicorniae TaxID=2933270 RepID=A0ABT0GFS1_9GAMM|nr:DUF6159 family protein [Lysobacter sp. CAU 1642]MCK7593393.1 DUF6159 family protein [Lysobacter sp. CAU 1642]